MVLGEDYFLQLLLLPHPRPPSDSYEPHKRRGKLARHEANRERRLGREVRLVLLLGDEHNADGGVRRHQCLDLPGSDLPDLHRDDQLPRARLQHQLHRQSDLQHSGPGHRKEQKLQNLQETDHQKQPPRRPQLSHQQLHRRVDQYQEKVQPRIGEDFHREASERLQEGGVEGVQQGYLRKDHLFPQLDGKDPLFPSGEDRGVHLPPRIGHPIPGGQLQHLHPEDRRNRLRLQEAEQQLPQPSH